MLSVFKYYETYMCIAYLNDHSNNTDVLRQWKRVKSRKSISSCFESYLFFCTPTSHLGHFITLAKAAQQKSQGPCLQYVFHNINSINRHSNHFQCKILSASQAVHSAESDKTHNNGSWELVCFDCQSFSTLLRNVAKLGHGPERDC